MGILFTGGAGFTIESSSIGPGITTIIEYGTALYAPVCTALRGGHVFNPEKLVKMPEISCPPSAWRG